MNTSAEPSVVFQAISSTIVLASMLTAGVCIASLRSHVDEAKIRKEESISSLFRFPIPPERILTDAGVRRAKIAKVAIAVTVVTVANYGASPLRV